MEQSLSNMNTGVRTSCVLNLFTVSMQTAMKALVSSSVPTPNEIHKLFYQSNKLQYISQSSTRTNTLI